MNEMLFSIRPAMPGDAPVIARLIMEAMNLDCCRNLGGARYTEAAFHAMMTRLVGRDDSQYSWRNTMVAEGAGGTPGRVVGICVAYDGGALHRLRKAFVAEALETFGVDHSAMADETQAGELYVDSLCVAREWRGQGIASALIAAMVERARALRLPAVGLLVDKGNPAAERLYMRLGFRFVNDSAWGGHPMRHLQFRVRRAVVTGEHLRTLREMKLRYAKGRTPSMKRRSDINDYRGRHVYLLTLVVEGRRRLLGEVEGRSEAPPGTPEAPRVVSSPLGEEVLRCWHDIERFYPGVKVVAQQLMPDHFHGILRYTTTSTVHLGQVVNGFKTGCNRAYRRLMEGTAEDVTTSAGTGGDAAAGRPRRDDRKCGLLFERGYNDLIAKDSEMLPRMMNYLLDNPRRLLMKREHPDLFRVQRDLTFGGMTFSALGNRFLLSRPVKLQVQCSRQLTEAEIESRKRELLAAAAEGAVLVSPAISAGEKAIMRAAFEAGYPLVYLQENGLTDLAKPGGSRMEACARGQLLILAPWEHHNERRTIRRDQCLSLNDMAKAICEGGK